MIKKGDKKGSEILTENIIFIVLNLVFLAILIAFLISRMGNDAVLEEKYAKQIAMVIDSSKPEMEIYLNMEKGIKDARANGISDSEIVTLQNNVITVKLQEKGGYSYSFFNDVDVENIYPVDDKNVRIKINKK
jgi:hypothetical protein